jgi:hypothetical protein
LFFLFTNNDNFIYIRVCSIQLKQNTNNKMGKRGGNSDKKKDRSKRRRNDFEKEREENTPNVEEDTHSYTSRIATQQPYTSRIATQQPYTSRIATQQSYTSRIATQQSYTSRIATQPNHIRVGTQQSYTSRIGIPSYTGRYFQLNNHQYPQEPNNNRICYCNDCVQERRQVSYGKNTPRRCYCYDCVQRDNSFIPNGCYSRSLY